MANLSITNICNRSFVYCFASDTRKEFGRTCMDADTYDRALDYLERSGLKQVRLLGGEPTLHPKFRDFITKALDRDFNILIFTNGLISDSILNFLCGIPASKIGILLNTIPPSEDDHEGIKRQHEVMRRLGKVINPGINIYSPGQDLDYLAGYVSRFNLKPEIRIGISHPVMSSNNFFLHPKDYQKAGRKVALFKKSLDDKKISLGFDCGFVPCMFPGEYLSDLSLELKKTGNCCHPINDLLTDGSFIPCYPLNNFKKIRISDQQNAGNVIDEFNLSLDSFRGTGIYPHCTVCPLFNNRCNGGCMSYRISRYIKVKGDA